MTAWAKTCLYCQQSKIHRQTNTRPLHIPVPQWRFSHLHIDLVGLLQFSNNCNYIFTIIDCTSKWMKAIPLAATAVSYCALTIVFHWITRFGVPATITMADHQAPLGDHAGPPTDTVVCQQPSGSRLKTC